MAGLALAALRHMRMTQRVLESQIEFHELISRPSAPASSEQPSIARPPRRRTRRLAPDGADFRARCEVWSVDLMVRGSVAGAPGVRHHRSERWSKLNACALGAKGSLRSMPAVPGTWDTTSEQTPLTTRTGLSYAIDRSSGGAAIRRRRPSVLSRPHASPCSPASGRFSDFQAR